MLPDFACESRGALYCVLVPLSDEARRFAVRELGLEPDCDQLIVSTVHVDDMLEKITAAGLLWRIRSSPMTSPAFSCPSPESQWIDMLRFEEAAS